ncbi:MAG: SDR family oxidoreductase [Calditrichaceae bacterium]
MKIQDKIALVTGASKGIGKSIALALAEEGAKIAISARGAKSLSETSAMLKDKGASVIDYTGDMSREDDIRNFVKKTVDAFGGVDILINNAGLGYFSSVAEMPTDKWDEMFNLNVRGLFLSTREALPYLRKSGESVIVNIASLAGRNAFIGGGGYAATKHAVIGFSRCLMLEERKNGIRVLAICPGSVDTEFFNDENNTPEPRRNNILRPEDVAESVLHMIKMPQRAMVSEIDIRPSNP